MDGHDEQTTPTRVPELSVTANLTSTESTAVGAHALRELRVVEMRREAECVLSLLLDTADGSKLPAARPGSHLDVRFDNGIERQYSLCPAPGDTRGWRVAVLKEEVSRGGSHHVHERLRVGDTVTARGPLCTFELVAGEPTVLVAGGIGITPLLPMAVALESHGSPWRLVYLGRTTERMAFLGHPLVGDARTTVITSDHDGRADLAAVLAEIGPGARVHACGPERLLSALEELAGGWPAGTLRLQRFFPKPSSVSVSADSFDVECRRSGISVTVAGDTSILATLEAAGLTVPCSCLEGVCGTCETPLLEGQADHRDSILTPDEREANDTMMICVSRAKTPRLVLDL